MKRFVSLILAAAVVVILLPAAAAAQCPGTCPALPHPVANLVLPARAVAGTCAIVRCVVGRSTAVGHHRVIRSRHIERRTSRCMVR